MYDDTDVLNTEIVGVKETIDLQGVSIDILTEKTIKIDEEGNSTTVRTSNGFTFDEEGLNINVDTDEFNTQINNIGTYYKDGTIVLGQTTKDGSKFKDMDLFGAFKYGEETITDTPMFVAQLYTDENDEVGFGHFYNGGD